MPSAPLHIDLDPGPEEADERIQAWRAALAFSHDVAVRPADRAGFAARLDGYHLGRDLLCAQFGLSRATLYRPMAPRGGVADIVRRHRIAHARLLLTTAQGRGLAFADIARRSGFKSLRTLRRGLREAYAASARDLRAAGPRQGDQAPPARPSASASIDAE